jgi:hypothetical protein
MTSTMSQSSGWVSPAWKVRSAVSASSSQSTAMQLEVGQILLPEALDDVLDRGTLVLHVGR